MPVLFVKITPKAEMPVLEARLPNDLSVLEAIPKLYTPLPVEEPVLIPKLAELFVPPINKNCQPFTFIPFIGEEARLKGPLPVNV